MIRIGLFLLTSVVFASEQSTALMTAQDKINGSLSNISIINGTSAPVIVYGLYIFSFDVNDCSQCFGNIIAGNNALGMVAQPVLTNPQKLSPIGQNYLYNLIYNGIYAVKQSVGSSPCALPGCSWPGDDPNIQGWCLGIGVMSLNSKYTYSSYTNGANPPANVVPFSQSVTSLAYQYNYDLLNPATFAVGGPCLGPIVCDDKTLTCSVSTAQQEEFKAY